MLDACRPDGKEQTDIPAKILQRFIWRGRILRCRAEPILLVEIHP
jgi:hypothetical protein